MIKFSVKNPVVVNLAALVVITLGIGGLLNLPRELFPTLDLNWVYIITPYEGASPEEVEKLVTVPIEEEIADVDGIESITSTSSEGRSLISVKFRPISQDRFDKALQDLRSEVDRVQDLPEDAEEPWVWDFGTEDFLPMITVNVSGDIPHQRLKQIAEDIKREINLIPHISRADIAGDYDREIWVEVDPIKLKNYSLSMSDIIGAIARKNVSIPGGTVEIGPSEFYIRTMAEAEDADDIANVVVMTGTDGAYVTVADLARVSDTHEKPNTISRLNGKPVITIGTAKSREGNSLAMIDRIKGIAEKYRARYGDEIDIVMTGDTSRSINEILGTLQWNALFGILFILIVLHFFLGFRNAFFAALGIPITFMATFFFLWKTGNSLNGNSMFGLVLVTGIVVDDAIIVLENCYRYIQAGLSNARAAYIGTKEVVTPVLSATATTVAAFLPLMFMPGIIGKFMKIVPIVVSLALTASLLEAFFILPSHIADWSGKYNPKRVAKKRGSLIIAFLQKRYIRGLKLCLRRRYLMVALVVVIFGLSGLSIRYLGVEMFRDEETPTFLVWITSPAGTRLEETDSYIRQAEKVVAGKNLDDVLSVTSIAGLMMTDTEWFLKSNVGQLMIELRDKSDREHSIREIMDMLRPDLLKIAGPERIEFHQFSSGPPVGKPVEVKVKGKRLDVLDRLAGLLKNRIGEIDGVYDIGDDFERGKKELRVTVDEVKAARYAMNPAYIATELRAAFQGISAASFRDGDEEVEIVVKFSEEDQQQIATIENLFLDRPDRPGQVPFTEVASIETEPGYGEIRRFNQDRAITVSAEIDKDKTSIDKVNKTMIKTFADIERLYPGYLLDFGGEFQEFKEAFSNLLQLFIIGVLLIYMILGAQFKSFIQPLIIIATVPFAIIGATFGLLVSNNPFSITTMYGIVALAGIVVNDSLVMVDFINKRRIAGSRRWRSIFKAGKIRLRPILATTVTTVFGLLPMAIGIGGKSVIWAPLALTIIWGLGAATFLTLFIIPALMAIVDDIKLRFKMSLYHQPAQVDVQE